MQSLKKIAPMIALIMTVTLLFSGCGIMGIFGSIGKKPQDTTIAGDVTPTGDIQPVENTASGDGNNILTSDNTASGTVAADGTTKSASGSTQAPVSTTKKSSSTTAKVTSNTTEAPTEADLSNLSVKEIQDLLFDTKDPNTAGKILTIAGFDYDEKQGIYYSTVNPLQRYFGYNLIYDIAAPRTGMVYSTSRVYFDYNGKNWMIQFWKGQYGITAGGEIGVYNKPADRVLAHYDCAKDDEMLTMSFDFYNNNEFVFSRGPEKHWWLTGFKIFELGVGILIDLDMTIAFPNREMADAFEKGLKSTVKTELLDKMTYKRTKNTFSIQW